MDYCSTCRRHLNGALVCPGCGAYAPDIEPAVVGDRAVPAATAAATIGATTGGAFPGDGTDPGDGAFLGDGTDAPPPAGAPHAVAAASGTGRAARRRQQVRWRKTQRRALVATAVALVGGGITLASLDRGTGDRAQAASAPDLKGMGGAKSPTDRYGAPDIPTPGPERTTRSSSTDDRPTRPADDDTPASTTSSDTRTDGTATPRTAVTTQPRTTSPDSGSAARPDTTTGTSTGSDDAAGTGGAAPVTQPADPPPATDDGTGTGSDSGTGQGTGGSEPAPTIPSATTPDSSQLCLLVICLGG